jgi:integrase
MTALILGADCLSNPTRYDVAAIKFMMLWPTILRCGRERLILTAARTGEVLEARWSEIDVEQAAWTIPACRVRAGREHRIPLAPRCIELLGQAKLLAAGSDFVFPGRSGEKPMSNMVLLLTMRGLKSAYTVHGFWSAFRDWASERTNFAREICEAALAHTVHHRIGLPAG